MKFNWFYFPFWAKITERTQLPVKSISLWAQRECSFHRLTGFCLIMFSFSVATLPSPTQSSILDFLLVWALWTTRSQWTPWVSALCFLLCKAQVMKCHSDIPDHWRSTAASSSALPQDLSWLLVGPPLPTDYFGNGFLEPWFGGQGLRTEIQRNCPGRPDPTYHSRAAIWYSAFYAIQGQAG